MINFKRADWVAVHQLLTCIYCGNFAAFNTVNNPLSHFYNVLLAVMLDCIPQIQINASNYPHWYDKASICLIKENYKMRTLFVKKGLLKFSEEYKKFGELRSEVN